MTCHFFTPPFLQILTVEQIWRVFCDNFAYFSIKTYVVGTHLKGNITFVCAHTANAAWFFPAIIVVTSNVTQKCQRRISRLFVSGFYALNTLYGTCVTWEFWFTNEISKRRWEKCITNRAEWTSSSLLHCCHGCCMTTRKYMRRWRGFITSWKIGGRWKPFSAEIFWSGQTTSWFYSIFQYIMTRSSSCVKITEMTMSGLLLS